MRDQAVEFSRKEFIAIYSKQTIREAIKSFEWDSKLTREEVEIDLRQAWADRDSDLVGFKTAVRQVHMWGFGNKPLKSSLDNDELFWSRLRNVLESWYLDHSDKVESLSRLLSLKGLGIATASKWICMLDQERFAIYDSRVSAALAGITDNGKRIFPIVGRRSVESKKYPPQDYRAGKAHLISEDYQTFILMLQSLQEHYEVDSVSELEKALFMLGKD